jgi:hypothetical protein
MYIVDCPRFALQPFSPKFTQRTFAANGMNVVSMSQDLRALYVKNNLPYPPHLGFCWRDFPETPYIWHSTHIRYKYCKFGCDRSIINGTLLKRVMYLNRLCLAFLWKDISIHKLLGIFTYSVHTLRVCLRSIYK